MRELRRHGGRPQGLPALQEGRLLRRALPKGRLALPQARVLPAQRLDKKGTSHKTEAAETKLPDSNVQHVKLPSTPSEESLNRKDSAGSAWNSAGTWEERDVLPKVRERIESVVKRVSDRDFGSGVISVDRVKSVTGDASVGVIRGKARQFLDVKIEVAFRVRVGGDDQAYKGTLILKDYSADAATEPVDVEVKFSDAARVPAHVRDAVRGALGQTGAVEAGATGTFARDVVGALAAELLPGLKDL
jgi:hypothetical protein